MRTYIDSTENWSTLRLIHLHRTQKLIHRNSSELALFPQKSDPHIISFTQNAKKKEYVVDIT